MLTSKLSWIPVSSTGMTGEGATWMTSSLVDSNHNVHTVVGLLYN
ncbi:hypothetical protein [Wolbachia endosymbiont (group A) of Pogonocherus hispidulus]